MAPKELIKRLKSVVDRAQMRIDLDAAQSTELRRAIHIVEVFLRKSGRVCYGGQAINAHLPLKDQFYNLETSLPDYDFFSPDEKSDTAELIEDLRAAGYTEISKRFGIHEGTTKIYVNYTAVADITQIDPRFYQHIAKNSDEIDGIHYADPLFLRMMMYLELSRPRGMIARWEKVVERLALLERAKPLKGCGPQNQSMNENAYAEKARPYLVDYIIKNHKVYVGADTNILYKGSSSAKMRALTDSKVPVAFLSSDAESDASTLSDSLGIRKQLVMGFQNILPAMVGLYKDDNLVGLIIQEEACHSYISMPLTKHRTIRVASLDTLLTFLIGLYYRDEPIMMSGKSVLCWIQRYIDLSIKYRLYPTKLVPSFPIECSGYQTTYTSLLRAKAARIEAARQRISSGTRRRQVVKRATRKRSNK